MGLRIARTVLLDGLGILGNQNGDPVSWGGRRNGDYA
jgi:hypothetical protein